MQVRLLSKSDSRTSSDQWSALTAMWWPHSQATDQQATHTGCAHFADSDFLFALHYRSALDSAAIQRAARTMPSGHPGSKSIRAEKPLSRFAEAKRDRLRLLSVSGCSGDGTTRTVVRCTPSTVAGEPARARRRPIRVWRPHRKQTETVMPVRSKWAAERVAYPAGTDSGRYL